MKLKAEAKKLVNYINSLGLEIPRRKPPHKHVGAIIADAVLQIGHEYNKQVKNRIAHLRKRYPKAATISGLVQSLKTTGAQELLNGWKGEKEHKRLYDHANFFNGLGINTFRELRIWLKDEKNRDSLITKGLGIRDRTADYYRVLVGLPDAVKVDSHVEKILTDAGIDAAMYKYEELRTIVQLAAKQLGKRPIDLDSAIWNYQGRQKQDGERGKSRRKEEKEMNEEQEGGKMQKDTDRLPQTYASPFARQKGYANEADYIDGLLDITDSYTLSRALYMRFFQKNGCWNEFKRKYWPKANTPEGAKRIKKYEKLSKAFLEYLEEVATNKKPWDALVLQGGKGPNVGEGEKMEQLKNEAKRLNIDVSTLVLFRMLERLNQLHKD